MVWFLAPFFFFLYHNLCILALVLKSKLWLGSPLCAEEFNSALQAFCVWTIGVDEENYGLLLTLCVSSSVADGMFTFWWQKSRGTWGPLWMCVCTQSCFWLLFLAPFPSPTPIPSILFLFPHIHFLFVVLLLPLPVYTTCLCYHCLLVFSFNLSGDFPDFSLPENHPSPFSNWTDTSISGELLSPQLYLVLSFFLHCGGNGEKK